MIWPAASTMTTCRPPACTPPSGAAPWPMTTRVSVSRSSSRLVATTPAKRSGEPGLTGSDPDPSAAGSPAADTSARRMGMTTVATGRLVVGEMRPSEKTAPGLVRAAWK